MYSTASVSVAWCKSGVTPIVGFCKNILTYFVVCSTFRPALSPLYCAPQYLCCYTIKSHCPQPDSNSVPLIVPALISRTLDVQKWFWIPDRGEVFRLVSGHTILSSVGTAAFFSGEKQSQLEADLSLHLEPSQSPAPSRAQW